MTQVRLTGLLAGAAAVMLTALPAAAENFDLKIAHFVTPKHSYSQWIVRWSQELTKKSNGQLKFKIFPGSQLGPPPKYYDIARRGQADIVWSAHGFTPGRFPLTEISNLPYLVGSAEIGTKVMNDPVLRQKYLDPEHKGVKVLMLLTHQPGNIHTAKKPIRKIEDIKGLRLRFASATIRDFITALGGTPVGLPPTRIAESMQKGTIDGAVIDYGGGGLAFRLGPVTKYTAEMYSYVTSFCLCMNRRSWDRLPANMKKLINDSLAGREGEVGKEWDKLDDIGKRMMLKAGMTPIKLTSAEHTRFRAVGAKVAEAKLAELEKRGMPARAVYKLMQELSEKHSKTSRNFWVK
ncbi:MAG TPA: TRAP transporter substrate-binding protein [Alphaproteobacteria bacterium]|nr:TRAP transporter substrate-binding protein [Alphaproteobacteria bacterium]